MKKIPAAGKPEKGSTMASLVTDALLDAAVDTLKLIPFLFVTYLLMEILERNTQEKSETLLARSGQFGPLLGGLIGIVPQCGFSAAAASLYSGGLISLGTLYAVFLSTSDEMLPIFLSEQVPIEEIGKILAAKAVIGIVTGFGFDGIVRLVHYRYRSEKHIHDLCEREHCGCGEEEGGPVRAALIHTLHITVFVFLIACALTVLTSLIGKEALARFLTSRPVTGVLLAGLVGLIPNCAASVMITELYLEGMLGTGQMMAGLLVGAGVGLLVLFRTNRHLAENLKITAVLYVIGTAWGLLIEALGF